MRFLIPASSIITLAALLLTGCDSLGLPNPWHHDEVPPEVKAAPRLVESAPDETPQTKVWPRLGDVPFKPKDFSPKPVYDHYMDELTFERTEAEIAKQKAHTQDPVPGDAAAPQGGLMPPQLPSEAKE